MRILLLLIILFTTSWAAADMQPLSGEDMADVTAQNGIAFEWDLQINTEPGTGTPSAALCTGADRTQCRFAIKFANREEASPDAGEGNGEWLVFKGFSGRIWMSRFNLDAYFSDAGATPHAATARFVDGTGATVSPYNKPGLKLTFPESIKIYNFRIGGMAIEYGDGLVAGSGFRADPGDANSFQGIAISNSVANQPATIAIDGVISVFGF